MSKCVPLETSCAISNVFVPPVASNAPPESVRVWPGPETIVLVSLSALMLRDAESVALVVRLPVAVAVIALMSALE